MTKSSNIKMTFYTILVLLVYSCQAKLPSEYIIEDKAIVPEGIAYSKEKNSFYLSSVGKSKVIKINRSTGLQSDFIGEYEYGYAPGVGVLVDDKRNRLFAIGGYDRFSDSLSSLFEFDLDSEELVNRYDLSGDHFLNDLIIDKSGNLYLTDSKDSSIYFLAQGEKELQLFYKSTELQYPNGIAISDDDSKLYVATFMKGVRTLDIQSKKILNKVDTTEISQGIDGLEYYKGDLYALQNGILKNTDNFRKLILSESEEDIIDVKIIDSHNPELSLPLTFCIVDGKAVVIANSNLQYLNQETFYFEDSDTIALTKLKVYDLNDY